MARLRGQGPEREPEDEVVRAPSALELAARVRWGGFFAFMVGEPRDEYVGGVRVERDPRAVEFFFATRALRDAVPRLPDPELFDAIRALAVEHGFGDAFDGFVAARMLNFPTRERAWREHAERRRVLRGNR